MSAECTGWVYRYSPAKGAAFQVHLAAADSANDQHGYELWMRQGWLAAKTRVSRRAASDALAWLCEHGMLELLESGKASGSANRYRFLMPDVPPVWTPDGAHLVHTPSAAAAHRGQQDVLTGVGTTCTQNPSDNPTPETKGNDSREAQALAAGFDRFWSTYPKSAAKGDALKAWPGAVKIAGGVEVIVAGAERYRDDPNRSDQFTKYPGGWLRDQRWADPPLPPRTGGPNRAKVQSMDSDRTAPAGRLDL